MQQTRLNSSSLCRLLGGLVLLGILAGGTLQAQRPEESLPQQAGAQTVDRDSAALAGQDTSLEGYDIDLKLSKSVYLNKQDQEPYHKHYLEFKNINKVDLYENKRLRKQIREEEQKEAPNYQRLEVLYERFISHFGIKNFSKEEDLDMLWKLGQIEEIQRDTSEALFFYSIALRNNSKHYKKIKLHFDALRSPKHNEYVELDYYYRIVAARLQIDTLKPPKGVLLKLGKHINSEYPDYAPYMHPTGESMIFTSRRAAVPPIDDLDHYQLEDLYITNYNPKLGDWDPAEKLPPKINTRFNEGSACLNREGTKLYFTRCNAPDGQGVCDLYTADYVGDKWKNVQNLSSNVNSAFWDSHPSLSSDGQRLYFCSNRPGGFGRTDIYVCHRQDDGSWGPAKNLGPVINTIEEEVTPFIHPINNTLYFSSTGQIRNFGRFDIFRSRKTDDHWQQPINLGPLVNTKGDEYYFSIGGKGEKLYYAKSSPRDPEDLDLYSFSMPMGARPNATVRLNGYLIDSTTGEPLRGIVVAIDRTEGTEIEPIYINDQGYFAFRLINNRQYDLMVLGEDAIRIDRDEPLTEDSLFAQLERSIANAKPLIFDALEFPKDKAQLTPENKAQLTHLISFLNKYPYCELTISGHTDGDGEAAYNKKLSKRRASNIRSYLLAKTDVPPENITARGHGESRPIYPNNSPANKAKNRRVAFDLVVPPEHRQEYREARGIPQGLDIGPSISEGGEQMPGEAELDQPGEAMELEEDSGELGGGLDELDGELGRDLAPEATIEDSLGQLAPEEEALPSLGGGGPALSNKPLPGPGSSDSADGSGVLPMPSEMEEGLDFGADFERLESDGLPSLEESGELGEMENLMDGALDGLDDGLEDLEGMEDFEDFEDFENMDDLPGSEGEDWPGLEGGF
jgi:outer membrane protein OmpA-like peptidoglycan-associated protein